MKNKILVIEVSEELFERICQASSVPDMQGIDIVNAINAIKNSTPLDTIKAEINEAYANTHHMYPDYADGLSHAYEIINKHVSNVDKSCRCNTCKNNDDELSGECYECIKNIQNHYKPKENEEV
jgi:hypothetical protein